MVGKLIMICLALTLLVMTEVWINTFLYRNHQSNRWFKFIGAEAGTIIGLLAVAWLCHWLYHFKVVAWIVDLLDNIWRHFIGYLPHWHWFGFSISPFIVWLVAGLVVAYIYFIITGLLKRHEIIHQYKQWQNDKQAKMLKGDAPTYKDQLPKDSAKAQPKTHGKLSFGKLHKHSANQPAKAVAKPIKPKTPTKAKPIAAAAIKSTAKPQSQATATIKSASTAAPKTQPARPARAASTNPHFLTLSTTQFDYHSKLGIQQAYRRAKQSGLLVMPTNFGYVALYADTNGLSALTSALRPTPLAKYRLPNAPSLVQFTTTRLQAITLRDYLPRLQH